MVEYRGDLAAKNLKAFCQEYLPRFSKRTDLNHLDQFSTTGKLPRVLLLSTKKDTPVIWRVLSGLYHKRITFIDAEVCKRSGCETHFSLLISFFGPIRKILCFVLKGKI